MGLVSRNNFSFIKLFSEFFIHPHFGSGLQALEVGVAVSTQASGIRLLVFVLTFGIIFASVKTITVFTHPFGVMFALSMRAAVDDALRYLLQNHRV